LCHCLSCWSRLSWTRYLRWLQMWTERAGLLLRHWKSFRRKQHSGLERSVKNQIPKNQIPKRQSPKRPIAKRQSPKRQSPKRQSPKSQNLTRIREQPLEPCLPHVPISDIILDHGLLEPLPALSPLNIDMIDPKFPSEPCADAEALSMAAAKTTARVLILLDDNG